MCTRRLLAAGPEPPPLLTLQAHRCLLQLSKALLPARMAAPRFSGGREGQACRGKRERGKGGASKAPSPPSGSKGPGPASPGEACQSWRGRFSQPDDTPVSLFPHLAGVVLLS